MSKHSLLSKLATVALALLLCRTEVAAAGPSPTPESVESLQRRIYSVISQPRYNAALWGVKVVSLDTHKTLYECNAGRLFAPASNSKLFTMALMLDRLGPDYRITTSLYAKERPNSRGTLKGDLVVYGRGDPTITGHLHNGDLAAALEPLVSALVNAGVKKINGDLIGDESFFHGPPFGLDWSWNDLQYPFAAEVSALTINDNALTVVVRAGAQAGLPGIVAVVPPTHYIAISNLTQTVARNAEAGLSLYRPLGENVVYVSGGVPEETPGAGDDVTVHRPAGLFMEQFREALARHGITVSGHTRLVNWLDRQAQPIGYGQWVELGSARSPALDDMVREVEKSSVNLYADLLLAHLGSMSHGKIPFAPDETSEDAGMRALRDFLTEAGVPAGEALLNEGSGLSNGNLATPNAIVKILAFMSRHKCAKEYFDALPVAGTDGTLRARMRQTVAAGAVHAKTGTSTWANSLSGYVTSAAGERLAFSLMLNRYQTSDPDHAKAADLDAIAVMLAGFTGRTGPAGPTGVEAP